MNEQDRTGFATLMFGLGETFGEPISETRMEIYYRALGDMTLADITAAASAHVRHSKFFPRPAELRDAGRQSVEDAAELAWFNLLRQIRRVGYTGTPTWDDDAARRAAMELFGGWVALCQHLPGEGPELLGWAKQFKAMYHSYHRRDERESLPAHATREMDRVLVGKLLSIVKRDS